MAGRMGPSSALRLSEDRDETRVLGTDAKGWRRLATREGSGGASSGSSSSLVLPEPPPSAACCCMCATRSASLKDDMAHAISARQHISSSRDRHTHRRPAAASRPALPRISACENIGIRTRQCLDRRIVRGLHNKLKLLQLLLEPQVWERAEPFALHQPETLAAGGWHAGRAQRRTCPAVPWSPSRSQSPAPRCAA